MSLPRSSFGDKGILNKRIPKSSKYDTVESVVDSGASRRKVVEKSTREYLKKRDEMFGRVSATEVYRLLVEGEEKHESIYTAVGGGGASEVVVDAKEDAEIVKPFLLLDVRGEDEFEKCHIMESVNYPAIKLNQDKISKELFIFRNKAGKKIIIYDNDERIAHPMATMFIQKGYENVYLLSGGLKKVHQVYPLLIDGEVPEELAAPPKTATSRLGTSGTRRSGGTSRLSTSRLSTGRSFK